MKRIPMIAALAVALLAACGRGGDAGGAGEAPQGLAVRDAWVRIAPPGSHMTAAYLVIVNPGSQAAVLTGVDSPRFGSVEVHETVVADGVSKMRHRSRTEVPPGGEVTMAPGGLHIMLMQPTGPMPADGVVPLELHFADGRTLSVEAPVGRPAEN